MFQDSPAFPNGKGRQMKAADVKFCFDRILDARSGTLGASYFREKVKGADDFYKATLNGSNIPAGGVSGFRVVDDTTFVIDLVKPFAAFKYYPALGFCYIYPKEAVDKYGRDFFRNLVGTGAFVLDHWDQDQELVLKRNPNYWRTDEAGNRLPLLDKVVMSFIKDEKQQINEFKLGHLEEAYRIPTEFFRNVIGTDGKPTPEYAKYQIHAIPALSTQFYGFLTTSDVFKDKRVRQAFNYAIDRAKIIRYVLQGQAAGPAEHGVVPGSIPGYDFTKIKGYTFDLVKARALMAEAGYPDGRGFPPVSLQLNSGGGRNELVAEAVQDMISKGLGIKVSLKLLEWAQHLDLIDNGKAQFFRLGWIADYPEPESFLNLFYGKNIPESGPSSINSTRYRNPQYDAIFEQALATNDDAKRYALYQQAEQLAVDDAPVLFIFHDLDYRLVQPYVRDYTSNAMDRRDLTWTWLDQSTK
jgi:peptide/nickel transport system substrate-binding protein